MAHKSVNDLAMIAAAGGGFTISGSDFSVNDLAIIGAAGKRHGARITITGADRFSTNELAQIGAAGAGAVAFEW